ncbi:sugar kinase [Microbacterium jejuense]|uniref:Sugar kinase n=1 Tax=Microbacterium jejuense TaxID=1263637 RepID=A0ABS7HPA0_9MICO|nr:sugar kinase [Microbacterium jejuense]MBW9094789.1 sugar kinase [Microbacterium jejuense]
MPRTLLAIGETMAMVAPVVAAPVADADEFLLDAGGAESNVAAHVAALGHRAVWFSRLGADALGRRIARQLTARGVDVSRVVYDETRRTGLYVKDPGNGVLYYRDGSAASALCELDAETVSFAGVDLLHVSGITAAISTSAASFLARVIERARAEGVQVSFDVNHRAPLWSAEVAAPALLDLARSADIVLVGRDEAETLWGTASARDARGLLSDVPELVVKDGSIGATVFTADDEVFEPALVVEVVEAVGAGDAFAGGYLAGRLSGDSLSDSLRAGHARAARTLRTTTDSIDEPAAAAPAAGIPRP